MNILCLAPYNFLPANIGGQKHTAYYYQFLAKEANLICVSTRNNDPRFANYELRNILSNSFFRYINPIYFFTFRKIIKEKKITHLQIEHPYYGWLGVLLKRFCDVKFIIHSHNIEALRFRSIGKYWWRLLWIYEKWVHKNADYNLFITDDDKEYAVSHYRLNPEKCITATYGIDWESNLPVEERSQCKQILLDKYELKTDTLLLLFNGSFNYKPNLDGLLQILNEINPILDKQKLEYAIIICGKNIPRGIADLSYPNVYIEGFVEDISLYFNGADIFINPIFDGGGIKTKLVEALGYDLFAISYKDGAIGIPSDCTEGKLFIVDNPKQFSDKIVELKNKNSTISARYFEHFYWGNVIERVVNFLNRFIEV
jgi:polysaccharide biosynthesis protein PslH